MPDLRHLLCVGVLALGPGAVAAQDCGARLIVTPSAPDRIAATYISPCAPYAPVTVTFGPLVFGEQTGHGGDLRLDLPALPAATGGSSLTVTQDGAVTRAALPAPAGPVPPFAAISWPDAPPPDPLGAAVAESGQGAARPRLGFPGETPVIDLLPATIDHIDLPITPATCGRGITGHVVTADSIRDLRVTLPACDTPMGALRLPLFP